MLRVVCFFFSSRRRHTRWPRDWSSDVCSSDLEGVERFGGRIVHPQHWTDDVEYEGKRVVVIGSGATAVTLVPALAEKAEHVTMLQRSPSYVVSVPQNNP